MNSNRLCAILYGFDKPGIVKNVSEWIFQNRGNILDTDFYHNPEDRYFFQRIDWVSKTEMSQKELKEEFLSFAHSIGLKVNVFSPEEKPKIILMCSKEVHCLKDIILRWAEGHLFCDIAGVISNHKNLEEWIFYYKIPFYYFPVDKANKEQVEQEQLKIIDSKKASLVVMARYMQILSQKFLVHSPPVINIHHSFLPAFAGAKPYHQAYERGVKIIGATAHYATEALDDGPIIQQDVIHINHRHTVKDLIYKGQDLEKIVLSKAVKLHLEGRVLVFKKKTIIFQ